MSNIEIRTPTSESKKAINEVLATVQDCLAPGPAGRVRGYSAALLLMSVIDAIGQRVGSTEHGNSRISVLRSFPFDIDLTDKQCKTIERFIRHALSHCLSLPTGVFLLDGEGDVFEFEQEDVRAVRIRPLHRIVATAWEKVEPTFQPGVIRNLPTFIKEFSFSASASGVEMLQPISGPLDGLIVDDGND